MGINATASKIRVLVGASAIDFSEALVSFVAGFDKRDRSGQCKVSGTLVLTALDNNLALLNPRLNYDIGGGVNPRALWSRGQHIRIQSADASGTLIDHRFSKLYILKEPLPPKSPQPQDARITLELGCELKLRDFAAPNSNPVLACDPEDPTLSHVGIEQSPGEVIRKLLVKAGVTGTWEGSIENYPFNYPVSNDSGSYLAVAGEVAFARFYALMQKRSTAGNITAVDYRAAADAVPLLTVTIGEDEADYEPVSGQETPCEALHCEGSTYDVTDTWQDVTFCKVFYAPGSNLVTRLTCTRDAQSATEILHEVTELEPRGLLAPDDFPGSDSLIFSRRTTNIKTYEANVCGNGKLLQEETIIVRPFRVAVSEFWSGLSTAQKANYAAFSPSIDTRTIIYYSYTEKEVIKEIESRTSRMLASVLPSVDPTTAGVIFQVPAASDIQTYREICPGQWEYTQASASPLIDVFPDAVPDSASVSEKIRLATNNPISTVSASGQNNPPATERRPDRHARNERQLDGVALFGSFAGANQQDRKRVISIPWMVSNEQASAIAQHLGAELIGRRQGAQILLALTDAWLTNENPYPVIHVREPRYVFSDDEWSVVYDTIVYQADALSFAHDRTRATVGCELIWLATIPAGATVPVLPYVPTVMRSGVAPVLSLSGVAGEFGSLITRSGVAPLIKLFAPTGVGATTIIRSGVAPVLNLSALSGDYTLPVIRSGVAPVLRLSALGGSRNASVERSGVAPVMNLSTLTAQIGALPSGAQPSAYWNLIANGNTAVGTPNLTAGSGVSFASGTHAALNGSTSATLAGADTADISVGNEAFTIGAWVYLNSTASLLAFMQKGLGGSGSNYTGAVFEYLVYYDQSALRFRGALYDTTSLNSSGVAIVTASTFGAPAINTWYYLVFYYKPGSPNTIGLSVNNGAFNTLTTTINHVDTATNMTLGYRSSDNFNLNGRMRYAGFWKDLPADAGGSIDLAYYYNGGAGRPL